MTNFSQKVYDFFVKNLFSFYKKEKRDLPWRKEPISAYEVWVSEIMLQQTQVSRVIGYYNRFLERFPTIESLAKASWEDFLPYYEGLGYYNRGRNMLKTAREVVEKYNGVFPENIKALQELPGIGVYTASAIASFAYKKPVLAWDTNFKRVFGRFFLGFKNGQFNKDEIEKALQDKCYDFQDLNASVMDFGSRICVRNPKCEECPLKRYCLYYKTGGTKEMQKKVLSEVFPTKKAFAYVILHENHKNYFSFSCKTFQPFMLPPQENSRESIKYFFETHYAIKVSVRPPKMKIFIKERPVLVVYAQILSGEYSFTPFPPAKVRDIINTWI
jgi:A/G-specific adenine glycosylase